MRIADIKAKVELNAIEATFLRDALLAYSKVCNQPTKADCTRMAAKLREAFGKNSVYIH